MVHRYGSDGDALLEVINTNPILIHSASKEINISEYHVKTSLWDLISMGRAPLYDSPSYNELIIKFNGGPIVIKTYPIIVVPDT